MIGAGVQGTVAFCALAVAGTLGWLSFRAIRVPAGDPGRLVAELRLAQFAALVLVMVAGSYVGLAVHHAQADSAQLEIALALGFLATAVVAQLRDPREALTALAVAFAIHTVLDVLHRPGLLSADLAPSWFAMGCAILNVYAGAACYLPVLRR